MFHDARIKLTVWYLLIIMTVSVSFSALIYRGVSLELERRFNAIQARLELRSIGIFAPPDQVSIFLEDLEDSKHRVIIILIYTNLIILVGSSLAGYFLAGKTLQPIESALEEQKRFVADASHEFKTPLTSLQTSIEVTLRDKHLTLKDARTVLKESLTDIQNLSNLSHYLLGLARYQKDNKFPREKIRIEEVIDKTLKKIGPLAKNKMIKIIKSIDNISIFANSESLEKLLMILLDNAVKYTKKGGTIEIRAKKVNRALNISVKDNGVGISGTDIPHIFERFYRADTSRSKEISGFGLGLSMAKQIVDIHGGEIKVQSKINEGSTFSVRLPL
jgi:two-component system, OmpR family, sensor histidine kinase CiaH